jgi:hypothetical protein
MAQYLVSSSNELPNLELLNLVYMIKSKRSRRTRKEKRKLAVEATRTAGFANPVQLIVEVRALAEGAGGMRRLKQLIDLLAQ